MRTIKWQQRGNSSLMSLRSKMSLWARQQLNSWCIEMSTTSVVYIICQCKSTQAALYPSFLLTRINLSIATSCERLLSPKNSSLLLENTFYLSGMPMTWIAAWMTLFKLKVVPVLTLLLRCDLMRNDDGVHPKVPTNMRQALLSFVIVVAALCVQQLEAVSQPFDKRAVDSMYIMLIHNFILPS